MIQIGRLPAATIEPRDTYLHLYSVPANARKANKIAHGTMIMKTPRVVAIPLPPLN
ncbi:MAG: hypothetical protein FD151_1114, partial [bacterium]